MEGSQVASGCLTDDVSAVVRSGIFVLGGLQQSYILLELLWLLGNWHRIGIFHFVTRHDIHGPDVATKVVWYESGIMRVR